MEMLPALAVAVMAFAAGFAVGFDEGDDLLRMLQAGCAGYALKESGPAELHNAILAALRNETVVPRKMLGAILRQAADYVPDPAADRASRWAATGR